MASSRVFLRAALCSLLILSAFIESTESARCCLSYTRRHLKCDRMLDYSIQTINASCDIHAVIFHAKGKFICADPFSSHNQKLMRCLDEKKKKILKTLKQDTKITSASA